jgi:FAD:protein FMN transferase
MGAARLSHPLIEARVERFVAMGTRVELHQFGPGAPDALARARRAIEAVDDALTIHRPSPATALNARLAAGEQAAVDDPVLWEALLAVDAAWVLTEGLFDPTVGRSGAGRWPALHFDHAAGLVTADQRLALDFGGFGKGFALDRAVAALAGAGVASAFLTAGESSVAVLGEHPVGGPWPVAVPHPLLPDEWLVELELADAALSISSTIAGPAPERSPMVRATDGALVEAPATAIAVAPTGAQAEAMSTALLVAPAATAGRLLGAAPGRYRFDHANARQLEPQQ